MTIQQIHHAYADLTIASEIPLPQLPFASAVESCWRVTTPRVRQRLVRGGSRYHSWHDANGDPWLEFWRRGDDRVVHVRGVAQFRVNQRDRTIVCAPASLRGAEASLPDLIVQQMLPLVTGLDRLVLHASAVRVETRAVAFIGAPGAGKSTMAAWLGHRGHGVISDDALIVNGMRDAVPVPGLVRLRPDTAERLVGTIQRPATDKLSLPLDRIGGQFVESPVPLRRIFLLDRRPTSRVCVEAVPLRDAAAALLQHAFVLTVDDPATVRETFERVTGVLVRVRVRRLTYPGQFSALPDVESAIRDDLSAGD